MRKMKSKKTRMMNQLMRENLIQTSKTKEMQLLRNCYLKKTLEFYRCVSKRQ